MAWGSHRLPIVVNDNQSLLWPCFVPWGLWSKTDFLYSDDPRHLLGVKKEKIFVTSIYSFSTKSEGENLLNAEGMAFLIGNVMNG